MPEDELSRLSDLSLPEGERTRDGLCARARSIENVQADGFPRVFEPGTEPFRERVFFVGKDVNLAGTRERE